MQKDTIDVIIPCYNRAETIGHAVQSALNQTVPAQRIIVVDDGSSDESGEIAAATHNKVTVIKQKNRGAAAARNRGIQESQAEWIAFLDSDDEWHPEKLEKQLHAADQFPDAGLILEVCVQVIVKVGKNISFAAEIITK